MHAGISWALAALLLCLADGARADLFVDPVRGNDTHSGDAPAQAFATIGKARDTIRARKLNQNMTGDLTVFLRGGRYELTETLVFDDRDSGSNSNRVVYKAYSNEEPVVCGGRKVTGWEPVAGKPCFVAEVPRHTPVAMKEVKDNQYYPPPHHPRFYATETFRHDGFADSFAQLYVNGVRAQRARSHTTLCSSQKNWWDDPATSYFRDGILVKKSDIRNYTNPEDIRILWLEIFKTADVRVTGILPAGQDEMLIQLKQPGFNRCSGWGAIKPQTHFFIVNALEELDEPGEWYLDRKKRRLYYHPFLRDGDLNQAEVIAPNVEVLVRIAGSALVPVRDLRFEGITFQCGNWTGANDEYLGLSQAEIWKDYTAEIPGQIILSHAQDVAIVGCTVRHMGSCGIQPYEYCKNILIEGNTTYDTTGAGISVGRYWFHKRYCAPESVCADITVANNIVRNTGRDYWQATGINLFAVNGAKVYHNDISDTAYTALHARIGDDGAGGYFTHPAIGRIEYKYNKVSRAFQGHKWGIGDGGHLYMHGRYGDCEISENYSLYANHNVNMEYYSDNNSYQSRWTKNVSRHSKAHGACFWIGLYNSGVVFDGNYSERPAASANRVSGNGGKHTNYQQAVNDKWPPEAQRIMDNAGLEPEWRHLYKNIYGHENIAQGKRAWASSDWDAATSAKNANDGNWNNLWSTKSGGDGQGWWAVDLGAPHVIQRVCIFPRQEMHQEHMQQNIQVQASNDPGFKELVVLCEQNEVPWYRKPGGARVSNMWEQYIPLMPGFRYLRVKSTVPAGSLNCAEFEAYGYPE